MLSYRPRVIAIVIAMALVTTPAHPAAADSAPKVSSIYAVSAPDGERASSHHNSAQKGASTFATTATAPVEATYVQLPTPSLTTIIQAIVSVLGIVTTIIGFFQTMKKGGSSSSGSSGKGTQSYDKVSYEMSREEQEEFLAATNRYRTTPPYEPGSGVNPVEMDDYLNRRAMAAAKWMAKNDKLTHHHPYGGYKENAGLYYKIPTGELATKRWFNARPGHYKNLMDKSHRYVGFGLACNTHNCYASEQFASKPSGGHLDANATTLPRLLWSLNTRPFLRRDSNEIYGDDTGWLKYFGSTTKVETDTNLSALAFDYAPRLAANPSLSPKKIRSDGIRVFHISGSGLEWDADYIAQILAAKNSAFRKFADGKARVDLAMAYYHLPDYSQWGYVILAKESHRTVAENAGPEFQ